MKPNPPKFMDITDWPLSEQGQMGAMYGEGALSKFLLKDSHNQKWMFKETWHRIKERYDEEIHHQYWSEIIASMIGHHMGINIPETHIGYGNHHSGEIPFCIGVLSKWFIQEDMKFIRGSEILQIFSHIRGTTYSEQDCTFLDSANAIANSYGLNSNTSTLLYKWAMIAIFDMVIGNTDRHHENWGILFNEGHCELSPAYDNGVSLGFREPNTTINTPEQRKATIAKLWKKYRYKYPASKNRNRKISDIIQVLKDIGVQKDDLLSAINQITTDNLQAIKENTIILNNNLLKHANIAYSLTPYVLSDNRLDLMLDSVLYRACKLKELIHDIYH